MSEHFEWRTKKCLLLWGWNQTGQGRIFLNLLPHTPLNFKVEKKKEVIHQYNEINS